MQISTNTFQVLVLAGLFVIGALSISNLVAEMSEKRSKKSGQKA